ncbi:hypothetical protein ABBQ32_005566 [Trebouxia sp. C0010 RCD-2024]
MQTGDLVTITGTGYFGAFRREVRQLTWKLGAQYSGDLTYGVTTHLVCKDSFLPDSEKVNVAHAWGIPTVRHAWLLDSVQHGSFLSVDTYGLDANSLAPTNLLPACLTARAGRHTRTHLNMKSSSHCSDAQQANSADTIEVEVLRKAASISCQLADLVLATTNSPTAGT